MKTYKNEALSLESLDAVSGGSFEETYRMASALFPEIVHGPMKSYQSWCPGAGNEDVLEKALTKKLTPQLIPPELTGKLVRNRRFAGIKSELGQVNFGALEPIEYNFLHFKEE